MEQKECCPKCAKLFGVIGCQGKSSCECHTSQNSGEVHFGTTNDAHADCKNSGDWGKDFDILTEDFFREYPNDWLQLKMIVKTTIDRAERRVKDELRGKIEKLQKEWRGRMDSGYLAIQDVLNLL